MLLLVVAAARCGAAGVAERLRANWTGFGMAAARDANGASAFSNFTMSCARGAEEAEVSCDLVNESDRGVRRFAVEENGERVCVREAESDFSVCADVFWEQNDMSVILRGERGNKRYFVTMHEDIMTVSIATGFNSEITLVSFKRNGEPFEMPSLYQCFKVMAVVVLVGISIFGIFKATDLSDVVRQDEGETALKIKKMSILADERKKNKKKTD